MAGFHVNISHCTEGVTIEGVLFIGILLCNEEKLVTTQQLCYKQKKLYELLRCLKKLFTRLVPGTWDFCQFCFCICCYIFITQLLSSAVSLENARKSPADVLCGQRLVVFDARNMFAMTLETNLLLKVCLAYLRKILLFVLLSF